MKSVRNLVAALCVLVAGHAIADQEPAIRLPDAVIDLEFVGNAGGMNRGEIRNWIGASADAVRNYYGQFPVRKLRIRVEATEGRGAQSGTTFSYNGALIRVGVGRYSDVADLKRDWVMTHEMVHLAMPEFSDDHVWLEEGLATYVEPVARAQIGQLTPAQIWHDMVRDMPKGLPAAGDRGLDNTHTWGRTYWGGALFYLIADLRIRERTGNRFGLQDGTSCAVEKVARAVEQCLVPKTHPLLPLKTHPCDRTGENPVEVARLDFDLEVDVGVIDQGDLSRWSQWENECKQGGPKAFHQSPPPNIEVDRRQPGRAADARWRPRSMKC